MLPTVLALILATAFPSASKTSWMTPQSFRLTIGMHRADAVRTLEQSGWSVKRGRSDDEMVIDYSDDKSLTLEFSRNRLHSIRFELFALLPEIRAAFLEQREMLRRQHGAPRKPGGKSVVLYDDRLPNIIVVLSDDPASEYGKKGIGYLAVRYYNPIEPAGNGR